MDTAPYASDRMVVIANLVSRVEAMIFVSVLEAAGSDARADGIHHASIAGVFSPLESLVSWPLHALSVPVNPQGRGEFLLVPEPLSD